MKWEIDPYGIAASYASVRKMMQRLFLFSIILLSSCEEPTQKDNSFYGICFNTHTHFGGVVKSGQSVDIHNTLLVSVDTAFIYSENLPSRYGYYSLPKQDTLFKKIKELYSSVDTTAIDSSFTRFKSFTLFSYGNDTVKSKVCFRTNVHPGDGLITDRLETIYMRVSFLPLKDTLRMFMLNEEMKRINLKRIPDMYKSILAVPPNVTDEEVSTE